MHGTCEGGALGAGVEKGHVDLGKKEGLRGGPF